MFNTYAHTAIDAIQTGKKQFVTTFVKHEGISKIFNDFIDAQTRYTKAAVDTSYTTTLELTRTLTHPAFFNESKDAMADSISYFVPDFLKPAKGKK